MRVLLFSVLRDKIGASNIEIEVPIPCTGADLLDRLEEKWPTLQPYRPAIRLAVDQTYVAESAVIRGGEELALITPVSGG